MWLPTTSSTSAESPSLGLSSEPGQAGGAGEKGLADKRGGLGGDQGRKAGVGGEAGAVEEAARVTKWNPLDGVVT